jgi:hypothetical protein
MMFCLPLAHIPSCFTENGYGRGDVNPVDLGEIGSSHAKEFCAQVELWRIPLLFLPEPFLPLFFRQTGSLASVLLLPKILLQPLIALGHLLQAKLVAILLLLQHKQMFFLPVAFQTARDFFFASLHPPVSERRQLIGIAFAG